MYQPLLPGLQGDAGSRPGGVYVQLSKNRNQESHVYEPRLKLSCACRLREVVESKDAHTHTHTFLRANAFLNIPCQRVPYTIPEHQAPWVWTMIQSKFDRNSVEAFASFFTICSLRCRHISAPDTLEDVHTCKLTPQLYSNALKHFRRNQPWA